LTGWQENIIFKLTLTNLRLAVAVKLRENADNSGIFRAMALIKRRQQDGNGGSR
jgi:hypothetical protein